MYYFSLLSLVTLSLALLLGSSPSEARTIKQPRAADAAAAAGGRERVSINAGWKFSRFTSNPDQLSYTTLKPWMLPSANDFIKSAKRVQPSGTAPGASISYVQATFDDSGWESLNLPHDWAIKGPFNAPGVGGGMGRLPSNGVGWYRRKLTVTDADAGKTIFLDVDGAMSYAAVWLNGNWVGGWPYGYASFRLDLTPYLKPGADNLLAVRVDNAVENSRWYPGAGIYRNVWLVKVDPVHVGQYGTYVTTPVVSAQSATVNLAVTVENKGSASRDVNVDAKIYALDADTGQTLSDKVVATFPTVKVTVAAGASQAVNGSATVASPLLWGPPPAQKPNMYVAVTTLTAADGGAAVVDTYETQFGIRSIKYDADKGVLVNGQKVYVQGTCNHHDLGSLGAAFNRRAAQRQLEMLQEMGTNALRTSHNPPAPEFLELADRMGFLVLDEIFDCWNNRKTTNDFHLIFPDWHEPDLRSFVRRDRNHPSVIVWSYGNEIGEQSGGSGAATAQELEDILRSEDATRPGTTAMNSASAGSAYANVMDVISLNYQGEGIGPTASSTAPSFKRAYPDRMIWSSESASTLSTRGTYLFPVSSALSTTVGGASAGGNNSALYVSAYDLYAPSWGSSPDKVFAQQDKNAFVAGEFVWTGFDYIGEPTPYNAARSSYFGIIDLAGFPKDRYWLYRARWRPSVPAAHLLPHWTWPDRVGLVTPVHVFTAADEAELFVNGASAGRKKRSASSYRLRWDDVVYAPGDLRVVAYKDGAQWATDARRTVGAATALNATADRAAISGAAGDDLVFVSVAVVDSRGDVVPRAANAIAFSVAGPGVLVSTDNGDPTDMTVFQSPTRKAFSGLALAVVRPNAGATGTIVVSATAAGLAGASISVQVV
ncbi:glycoside hydrolase family 2 protein [Lasiosphaeria miniovina]|uniref:Glycoside hydrolase family 2 protein n=1 Tax=Lasiosphaeria miniovina TaxID=1954250 RepID=A0AA40B523_9PEZI|nr:glycoside hydrolase family 2 protein [Lasiosphaeria miniovina]KAK0727782.1 glycoside hydrolase family 2 protein [Lasiosphaeria miniovina]